MDIINFITAFTLCSIFNVFVFTFLQLLQLLSTLLSTYLLKS